MRDSISGAELLRAWVMAKTNDPDLSLVTFARSVGMGYDQTRLRLHRARLKYGRHGEGLPEYGADLRPAGPGPAESGPAGDLPAGLIGDQVKTDQDGNGLTLESGFGQRITTLGALLEYAQVNLDEWKVERWVINKWEVGAKDSNGAVVVTPLIQVKAWLQRVQPLEISPVIKPMALTVNPVAGPQPASRPGALGAAGLRVALILPDPQIGFNKNMITGALEPFHDRLALDVALQVARSNHFDDIIWLGDLLDLPDWSDKFTRSPEFYFHTQSAIIEAAWWLGQFRLAQPRARLVVIEGNHEKRLREAAANHLAAGYALRPANEIALPPALSVPRLLGLGDLEAEWVGGYPKVKYWLNDSLAAIHGSVVRGGPGDTAKAVIGNSSHSVIFGHIHRIERASRTQDTHQGQAVITAISPGCLCRLDYVVPGHEPGQHWQQGIGVAYYNPDNGYHALESIMIDQGQAVWAGQVYQGKDRLPALIKDSGWAQFRV